MKSREEAVEPLLEELREILQPLSSKQLTRADLKESLDNLVGYFKILLEWYDADQRGVGKENTFPKRKVEE